ncbi:hypothetical protein LTR50_004226 [Elasticomyces elasticus]|nr:hypothetical protein LTR50_004226 [Elasticomyces elasticus]
MHSFAFTVVFTLSTLCSRAYAQNASCTPPSTLYDSSSVNDTRAIAEPLYLRIDSPSLSTQYHGHNIASRIDRNTGNYMVVVDQTSPVASLQLQAGVLVVVDASPSGNLGSTGIEGQFVTASPPVSGTYRQSFFFVDDPTVVPGLEGYDGFSLRAEDPVARPGSYYLDHVYDKPSNWTQGTDGFMVCPLTSAMTGERYWQVYFWQAERYRATWPGQCESVRLMLTLPDIVVNGTATA